jgi:DNA primase
VKTAVAACGTAFGDDHFSALRRLLMDDNFWRGEIIFTFDGDAAGQAAALKAFLGDQKVAGQTYVVVSPDGQDPCEMRQRSGDAALRDLVARREPLFDFALRQEIAKREDSRTHALTYDSQVEVMRWAVPIVAQIKDHGLRKRYATQLAEWTGWQDPQLVYRRVDEEARKLRGAAAAPTRGPRAEQSGPTQPAAYPDPRDPVLRSQRQALTAGLQYPEIAGPAFDALEADAFTHPAYAAVRTLMAEAGGASSGLAGADWIGAITDCTDDLTLRALVSELASEPLPVKTTNDIPRFITGVLANAQAGLVGRQIAELKSRLHRVSSTDDPDTYMALFGDLVALEQYRKSLLDQAMGSGDFASTA